MIPIRPKAMPPGAVQVVFAKDQPEYEPLPAALDLTTGCVTTEWEFTAAELATILAGGRVRLTVWTFMQALQPVQLEIVE